MMRSNSQSHGMLRLIARVFLALAVIGILPSVAETTPAISTPLPDQPPKTNVTDNAVDSVVSLSNSHPTGVVKPAASNDVTEASSNVPVAKRDDQGELSALPPKHATPSIRTNNNELDPGTISKARERLEFARHLRTIRQTPDAAPILVELLAEGMPESIKQEALLELAALAQDELNLSRAQQVYAQFINRWPDDLRIPEVLLRQGELFRQMGLDNLALTKFYAVMTSALVLKNNQFDYYANLVQRAQTEIAETHYQLGKYGDAAECLSRLLKLDMPAVNRPHILYKLMRSQVALGRHDDAVATGQDYLSRYSNAPERPEVQFYLANALKQLGRDNEALQQVLALLSEQRARANERPEVWAYWQQRAGNVIANQLYREGDYAKALDIYTSLSQLDTSPQWQLPVAYQIGMTYERLMQPKKATETYVGILNREKEFSTNMPPSLKSVLDMARWRIDFIEWQEKAEAVNRNLQRPAETFPTEPPAAPLASLPKPVPALP